MGPHELSMPLVSAIIPTHKRPESVANAIKSAAAQTYRNLEIIVVIDGADPVVLKRLHELDNYRLRIVVIERCAGGGEARNVGVREAKGEWIAFLDDDDVWLPEKIEKQLAAVGASSYLQPIVTCRLIARGPNAEWIWPRKPPKLPISEYLFCRSSLFQGEGLIQTSSIFASRHLLLDVPFQSGLDKHQDWDWLLRASVRPNVGIEFVPDAQLIWRKDPEKPSISNRISGAASREWLRSNAALFTRRAYAGFLLTVVAPQFSDSFELRELLSVISEAFFRGRPRGFDLFLFIGFCLLPRKVRYLLRRKLS